MIGDAARDDFYLELLELRSDDRVDDCVAATDELVAAVVDDIDVKVAFELGRIAVVQGLECAVHDQCRRYGHDVILLEVGARRIGDGP